MPDENNTIPPQPTIHPLKSGHLAGVGYDEASRTLVVTFTNDPPGVSRHYADVDAHVFDSFRAAESPGKYFASFVRPHYPHLRIVHRIAKLEKETPDGD